MTFGQRFLLTLIIVIIILFALAAFGYFSGGWDAPANNDGAGAGAGHLQPNATAAEF
jgi:hypothetical protein